MVALHSDEPFRRRQSARLVRKCDFQARSFDGPNSVRGLRIRGARSGRRPLIVRGSVSRVRIGRVGRRHVCMLELRRRRPDVRTLAPGNAFAHRSRAVEALDPGRARLGLPERRLEGRIWNRAHGATSGLPARFSLACRPPPRRFDPAILPSPAETPARFRVARLSKISRRNSGDTPGFLDFRGSQQTVLTDRIWPSLLCKGACCWIRVSWSWSFDNQRQALILNW